MSNARPRILIVEDDDGVRQALERGLARAGFETVGAALRGEAMRTDDHYIALVDLGLPDSDGAEICKQLRTRHPGRPIIVVTGRHDEFDVVDSLDSGADGYVTKPFFARGVDGAHPSPPRPLIRNVRDRRAADRPACQDGQLGR